MCPPVPWLYAMGEQTIPLNMNVQDRNGLLSLLYSWVCMVLWVPPSSYPYLYSLLFFYVVSCTTTTLTPVGYPSVCIHVYFPPKIPLIWIFLFNPFVGSRGMYSYLPLKCLILPLCAMVGMYLPLDQSAPPLLFTFPVLYQVINMNSLHRLLVVLHCRIKDNVDIFVVNLGW